MVTYNEYGHLSDKEKGARTIDENTELAQRPRANKAYNVSRQPLFRNIPLKNVVIDNLHLFLRVSDVLIDLLVIELRRQDAIEKVKKFFIFSILSKPAKDLSDDAITEFQTRARKWGESFVEVYQQKHVTPYIHALMNHVGEFMQIHGSILPFTQQGLEKKNDVITKSYFRFTCHQGETALRQILEKQNRIEHLESSGVKKSR